MKSCPSCGHPLSRWSVSCDSCEDQKRAELLRSKSEIDSIRGAIIEETFYVPGTVPQGPSEWH